jgi:hypothetical protein
VTPAAHSGHVEVLVRENDAWRAACCVSVIRSPEEIAQTIRRALDAS